MRGKSQTLAILFACREKDHDQWSDEKENKKTITAEFYYYLGSILRFAYL